MILDANLALLLAGPIVLDTVNFAAGTARFTEKDVMMFQTLLGIAGDSLCREDLFAKLQEEKFSVSSLSSWDLLRKDYKEWSIDIGKGYHPL